MSDAIIPFKVEIGSAGIEDLRRRLAATRWPDAETVGDWSQGIPLAYMQELCALLGRRATTGARARRAQRLPAVHDHDRRPRHPLPARALAARRRAAAGDDPRLAGLDRRVPEGHRAAHRPDRVTAARRRTPSTSCAPRCPGYGFSGKPTRPGWGVETHRRRLGAADAAARLRQLRGAGRRLGLDGHHRASACATRAHCRGIHLNMPIVAPDPTTMADLTPAEQSGAGRHEALPRPRTPATPSSRARGRRRWATASSTRRPGRPRGSSRSSGPGPTATATPRTCSRATRLLDNVMLYWLPDSAASSARLYWESFGTLNAGRGRRSRPACSIFPKEIFRSSRRWAEQALHTNSSTGTSSTAAATSPPSSSRSCSWASCAPASARCADRYSVQ